MFTPDVNADDVDVREKDRMVLACIKNAAGDVAKLKADLNNAEGFEKDKNQYLAWLHR
jgi:hypothetical protein